MSSTAPKLDVIQALRSNRWLAQFPADALAEFAAVARWRRFADGDEILGYGEIPAGLAVVVKGAIRSSSSSEAGREVAIALVQPGGIWGIIAVLDGGGTTHAGAASGETELLIIPAQAFRAAFDRWPHLYSLAITLLCSRLRKAYNAVDDLVLSSLRQRLAVQLCILADSNGDKETVPTVSTTQEDLAMLIGATRPSVNRELAAMESEGLLKRKYRRLELLDLAALRQECAVRRPYEV